MNTTILGLIACSLTTGAFLPQIIKIIKTKDTKDISLWMYIIYSVGIILWIFYGYLIEEKVIFYANFIALFFGISVIVLKLKHK